MKSICHEWTPNDQVVLWKVAIHENDDIFSMSRYLSQTDGFHHYLQINWKTANLQTKKFINHIESIAYGRVIVRLITV